MRSTVPLTAPSMKAKGPLQLGKSNSFPRIPLNSAEEILDLSLRLRVFASFGNRSMRYSTSCTHAVVRSLRY